MSKYKAGDKVILTVTGTAEMGYFPRYVLNDNFNLWKKSIDELVEPLTTYTEPLEAKIRRQAAEITRLLAENERLKAENKKMGVKLDAYELYGDQHEEEYNQTFNQGAEAAWELARKIVIQDGYSGYDLYEIFGCSDLQHVLENYTYPEAAAKVAEWEKAKEEIKVGDVLEDIADNNVKCVVTKPHSSNMAYLVFSDGSAGLNELDNLRKTGRHTDMGSFLKQIGEENNE